MDPFDEHREVLFAAAYRILGTRTDADDVLQEAWLSWSAADRSAVEDPRGYLFRVVTRKAIDQLRKVKARREAYIGPWLPEPLIQPLIGVPDAGERAELAESVSMAMLVVLETLTPIERAVFVLHESFGFEYAEIAGLVGRTERAARQLGYRARQHVRARRPRFVPTPVEHREITGRFLAAAFDGDLAGLMTLLAPDVTLWVDAGGKSETARHPLHGRVAVAEYLAWLKRFWPAGRSAAPTVVNGAPGAVVSVGGQPYLVFALEMAADGQIRAVRAVLNPDKIRRISG